MGNLLCHIGQSRGYKPQSRPEYGRLRETLIQSTWQFLSEENFIERVTTQGCPFYQCLFNGADLLETGREKESWRVQVFAGLDYDQCPVSGIEMVYWYAMLGLRPWLAYHTFSHENGSGTHSYRILWKVCVDLNLSYEECSASLKHLRIKGHNLADKYACNPTRLWQGTNKGFLFYDPEAEPLQLRKLQGK